jgi:DNA-binding transcriptional LysR family regulator
MPTLDELKTLKAVAEEKSILSAAKKLKKGHSNLIYHLKNLEAEVGMSLLDKSGYRISLTSQGKLFLQAALPLLEEEESLKKKCDLIRSGWESEITVVADGIVSIDPVLSAFSEIRKCHAPTLLRFSTAFLSEVETRFVNENADFMISVLPPTRTALESIPSPTIAATLVCSSTHPLAERNHISARELAKYSMVTVQGSDPRLNLSTGSLPIDSYFHVNDFHTKKSAILKGIGFGWMP